MYISQKHTNNPHLLPNVIGFWKKWVPPIIFYVNWHHVLIAIFKRKKMRYIMACQSKLLYFIAVLLWLSLVGNRDLNKNNAIAIDHFLREVNFWFAPKTV